MSFVFILLCLACNLLVRIIHRSWINPFAVMSIPYIFIVSFNKLFGEGLGFFPITDESLFVIILGLMSVAVGILIVDVLSSRRFTLTVPNNQIAQLRNYNIDAMLYYSLGVEVLGVLKLSVIVFQFGLSGLVREGALVSGLFGHLLLSIYPIQPILLFAWFNNKRKLPYVGSVLLTAVLLFASFVKYHVISYVVTCFFFLVLSNRKYLKKGTVILITLAVAFFVTNYVIDFIVKQVFSSVSSSFYINHLWKYVAGAVINSDAYLSGAMGGGETIHYKALSFIFAFPNMFITKIATDPFFPHTGCSLVPVSIVGEESNVVDAITYMFTIDGDAISRFEFMLYYVFFGMIIEAIFVGALSHKGRLHTTLSTVLSFFVFFSFFGTFYVNSMPWEVCIYSVLITHLFDNTRGVRFVLLS